MTRPLVILGAPPVHPPPLEIRTAKEARRLLGWMVRDDDPMFASPPAVLYKTPALGPTIGILDGVLGEMLRRRRRQIPYRLKEPAPIPGARYVSPDVVRLLGLVMERAT